MQKIGNDYLLEIDTLRQNKDLELDAAVLRLRKVLDSSTRNLLTQENVDLGRLFDRLVFIFEKYTFYPEVDEVHKARIYCNKVIHGEINPSLEELEDHLVGVENFIKYFFGLDSLINQKSNRGVTKGFHIDGNFTQGPWRCVINSVAEDGMSFLATVTTDEEDSAKLLFKLEEFELNGAVQTNLIFKNTLGILKEGDEVNLLRIYQRSDYFVPLHIVYYPDFLINVTSIANSVLDQKRILGNWEIHYLYKLLEPISPNSYFLRGNLVNDLLDELILSEKEFDYRNWFKNTFKNYPLDYTVFTKTGELEKIDLTDGLKRHFAGLKEAIRILKAKGVDLNKSEVEPSFLQPVYGLQGRLDLMYFNDSAASQEARLDIVELKTSKVYGSAKIKPDNAAQVSLYDLLTRNVSSKGRMLNRTRVKGIRAVLYSHYVDDPLRDRIIPFVESQFLMSLRNHFVQLERKLAFNTEPEKIIDEIIELLNQPIRNLNRFDDFAMKDWLSAITRLDNLHKKYIGEFIAFSLREKWYSKMGNSKSPRSGGFRETWLKSLKDKKDDCSVIADLKIDEVIIKDSVVIQARFSRDKRDLGNDSFKKGDIVYLIEQSERRFNVENSLISCTVESLTNQEVLLSVQQPQKALKERLNVTNQLWLLEHRLFESSYKLMLNNLFALSRLNSAKINTLLGKTPPRKEEYENIIIDGLTVEQQKAVNGALQAKDYFLIHGVPGSGKTSRVIKNIVKYEMTKSGNLLLLAYTNKAADKLSEVMMELNGEGYDIPFFRLGRVDAMSDKVKSTSLDSIIEQMDQRDQIQKVIDDSRVVISTVSGVPPTHIIFKTKEFRTAIIDEASQILEPTIIGLLCKVDKYIMVGDHNQLPAITLHSEDEGVISQGKDLQELGVRSLKNSYFERMIQRSEENNWNMHTSLFSQGRMHEEIMRFPSHVFYGDRLKVLNDEIQKTTLNFSIKEDLSDFEKQISDNRILFFSTPRDLNSSLKTNSFEADLVAKTVKSIEKLYGGDFNAPEQVGIITPFRNQRGAIRQELLKKDISGAQDILVDTVESFQGSEKDHIIISFSVNNPAQIEMIVEWNQSRTIDRKLNVALTRAKKQIILIGNDSVLSHEKLYGNLIEYCKSNEQYYIPKKSNEVITKGESLMSTWFFSTFDQLVIEPIKKDPRTQWHEIILGKDKYFNRSKIIEGGRADFNQTITDGYNNVWNPSDRVLAYCYWNMRIHYHTSNWCFQKYFQSEQIDCFIDVGCGPGTSALAFSEYATNNPQYHMVDISESMLNKARQFLDLRDVACDFKTHISSIEIDGVKDCVLLNFSFLFANVDSDFAEELKTFVEKLVNASNRLIVVNQNSANIELNREWDIFEDFLSSIGFNTLHKSDCVELSYMNNPDFKNESQTKFSFTILSN